MSDDAPILVDIDEARVTITLNRPDVVNSLDEAMVAALHDALDRCADARVVVIRGSGRGFSAGRDLSNATPLEEDARAILADLFNPVVARLRDLPMPTIAAVHGAALGVGFGIAMACDIVIAAERSRLGSPFANIGCVLDSGGHAALVQRVGPHRALELIYTSRLLDGSEAAAIGLVNEAVADDDLRRTRRCALGTDRPGSDGGVRRVEAHRPPARRSVLRLRCGACRRSGRAGGAGRRGRLRGRHHRVHREAVTHLPRYMTGQLFRDT